MGLTIRQTPVQERLVNGVKARADGKGDPWANLHREGLGNEAYMQDVDAMVGLVAWSANTAERLFLEVVPDSYENRVNEVRNFAALAYFDRKRSLVHAMSEANRFSRQVYTWHCRMWAELQPEAPKFFFVIGGNEPPWEMWDVDIYNPQNVVLRGTVTNAKDFEPLWRAVGLFEKRQRLVQWVMNRKRLSTAAVGR